MIPFANPHITNKEIIEVTKVLRSKWLTTGQKNEDFAKAIRVYAKAKYVVCLNSCTAALHLALICANIKPGDEIITSPFTFVSTINTIVHLGAKPIFVDIKEEDYILNEDKIEEKITKHTKAIIAVHYGGFTADIKKLRKICNKYNLKLIEDAAHAFGSKYMNEYIGEKSSFCCFSFYPTKNITTAEGGAFVTNNPHIYKRALALSSHGINKDSWKRYRKDGSWVYDINEPGYKYNLSDLHAALGVVQIKNAQKLRTKREIIFNFYRSQLSKIKWIEILEGKPYSKAFRHLFVIKIRSKKISRDQLIIRLKEKNIICSVHFIPVYHFSYYKRYKVDRKEFPNTERAFKECLSLPFSSSLTLKQAREVVHELKLILNE